MKKLSTLGLIAFAVVIAFIIPISAAVPGRRLTGGGWFYSDWEPSTGDRCNFAVSAWEVSGSTWTGHCFLRDRDSGETIFITIESLDSISDTWIWLLGTGRLYVNNEFHAEGDVEIYYEYDEIGTPHHHFKVNFFENHVTLPDHCWFTWSLDHGNINLQ